MEEVNYRGISLFKKPKTPNQQNLQTAAMSLPDEDAYNYLQPGSERDFGFSNRANPQESVARDPIDEFFGEGSKDNISGNSNMVQVRPFDQHSIENSSNKPRQSAEDDQHLKRKCTTDFKPEVRDQDELNDKLPPNLEGVNKRLDLSTVHEDNIRSTFKQNMEPETVGEQHQSPVMIKDTSDNSLVEYERRIEDWEQVAVDIYNRIKDNRCSQEDYYYYSSVFSPYIQLRFVPKPISKLGEQLMTRGKFVVSLIEYVNRLEPDNLQSRLTMHEEISNLFLLQHDKEEFMDYKNHLQSRLKAIRQSQAQELGQVEQSPKQKQDGSKLKRKRYEGSTHKQRAHKGTSPTPDLGTGYEYIKVTKPSGQQEVHLARRSKRIKSKEDKSGANQNESLATKPKGEMYNPITDQKKRAVSQIKKNHGKTKETRSRTNKKATAVALVTNQDSSNKSNLNLKFLKQHLPDLKIIQNPILASKEPLTQQDQKIHQFLHSQQQPPKADQKETRRVSPRRHTQHPQLDSHSKKSTSNTKRQPQISNKKVWKKQRPWPPSPKMSIPKDVIASEYFKLKSPPYFVEQVICSNVNGNGNYAIFRLNKAARWELGLSHCVFPITNLNRRSGHQMQKDLDTIKEILCGKSYLFATGVNAWPQIEQHRNILKERGLPVSYVTFDKQLEELHMGKQNEVKAKRERSVKSS